MYPATHIAAACITGAEAPTSATGSAPAVSSVVEHPTDNGVVTGSNPVSRTTVLAKSKTGWTAKVLRPLPTPVRRWRSTDALTMKVGAWGESELQIPTAEFDSRSTCNVTPMDTQHRQQRERQQRLQRQCGAVTARFTASTLSV